MIKFPHDLAYPGILIQTALSKFNASRRIIIVRKKICIFACDVIRLHLLSSLVEAFAKLPRPEGTSPGNIPS